MDTVACGNERARCGEKSNGLESELFSLFLSALFAFIVVCYYFFPFLLFYFILFTPDSFVHFMFHILCNAWFYIFYTFAREEEGKIASYI